MHNFDFDWLILIDIVFFMLYFIVFYHDNYHFEKQFFRKPCLFHWGYVKHWTKFKYLSIDV